VNAGEGRCSLLARESHAQVAGTSREAGVFFLVQQEGAWPRDAVGLSHLSDEVKEHLSHPDLETFLVRGHPRTEQRLAFLAQIDQGRLQERELNSEADLLALDADALVAGVDPGWSPRESLLLVCTHSKRDRCCAEFGRPIFNALSARWPQRTWEISHVGGHRFAGNLVVLPQGWFYGNLDVSSAVAAVEALDQGRLVLEYLRGRAGCSAQVQYAEIELRKHLGHDQLGGVEVIGQEPGRTSLTVSGASYLVESEMVPGPDLLLSCRDDQPRASTYFETRGITRL